MKHLTAWLEGTRVGEFTLDGTGLVRFAYDKDAGSVPISVSLPHDGKWKPSAPGNFLDNLLPDNPQARLNLASKVAATSTSAFDLLSKIGEDLGGGLTLSPSESWPEISATPPYPADDTAIAARISSLKRDAAWIDGHSPLRFSLAGAQGKFAMALIAGDWYWPSAALPSTHIFKPGSDPTPMVIEVEVASMKIAAKLGIPTPHCDVFAVHEQRSYIVERFDRDTSQPLPTRIHAEDFAQALGVASADKYAITAEQSIAMLKRVDPTLELAYQFISQLACNTYIGNCDAHAKNYSLLIRPTGITLSPAYDVVATRFWPQFDTRLAMRIAAARTAESATDQEWAKLARGTGLNPDRVVSIARSIRQQLLDLTETAVTSPEPQIRQAIAAVLAAAKTWSASANR